MGSTLGYPPQHLAVAQLYAVWLSQSEQTTLQVFLLMKSDNNQVEFFEASEIQSCKSE